VHGLGLIHSYTLTDDFDKDFGVDEWHGHNAFIAAKNDQVPFAITPKGTLTRAFVVAGTGFEPVTSGL
jgi:hypothetical protein